MKKKKINKQQMNTLESRDFIKEYNELLEKFGLGIQEVDANWRENSGHIKKFSLLEKTPTPILTNSSCINELHA